MRIFKNTWFARFAEKEGITDAELRELVNLLEAGQPDADLGGGVYEDTPWQARGIFVGEEIYFTGGVPPPSNKMRLSRPGEGKSGGYRVIVFFRSEERTFYEYGFAKSDKANISRKELKLLKETARKYFSMTPDQLRERIEEGKFVEL